ncbi:hypothetical protein GCM10010255_10270 [Streptomyces coeruleofuscus]|uniref:Uncharacterized protein n=1 Tax=Streptomyces coeruleofuscus TaxID=66879 RepID=A0ABN3HPI6_9ACTN
MDAGAGEHRVARYMEQAEAVLRRSHRQAGRAHGGDRAVGFARRDHWHQNTSLTSIRVAFWNGSASDIAASST